MPVAKQPKYNRVGILILESEEDLEGMTEAQYNRWADGGRAERKEKKVDPETADAVRRAFGMEEK